MELNKLKELPVEEFINVVEELIIEREEKYFIVDFVGEQSEDLYDEVVFLIEKMNLDITVEEYEATEGVERSNLFTDSTSDFHVFYYDMLMNYVEELDSETDKETTNYFLSVDYEEFKPSTYNGMVILDKGNNEIFRTNLGEFEKDYQTALLYFNERFNSNVSLLHLSSVNDYVMDVNDK